jgi:hypothetical protein
VARKLSATWNEHKDIIHAHLSRYIRDIRQCDFAGILSTTLSAMHAVYGPHRDDWEFPDPSLMNVAYTACPQGQHLIITICVPPEHHYPGIKRKGRQWLLQMTYPMSLEMTLLDHVKCQDWNRLIATVMALSQRMVKDLKLVDSHLIDLSFNPTKGWSAP